MKILYTLLITCFLFSWSEAQEHQCGTPSLTKDQRKHILNVVRQQKVSKNTGTTCLPIKAHIFREDNGSGGITNEQLAIGLTYLNSVYYQAGIEFFYCGTPEYINNSDLFHFDERSSDPGGGDDEADLVAATTEVTNAVNIYFLDEITFNGGFQASGYAYFPADAVYSNRVVMTVSGTTGNVNGTYNHEFGHYFSLPHTHDGTENGPGHTDAENVDRAGANSNCASKGDMFCDTDADPRSYAGALDFNTCMYTGDSMDIHGVTYTPPINNIMSYWFDNCVTGFTAQQITQIGQGLTTRQGHSSYNYTCVPAAVAVPTNLMAALNANENGVDLSWTDAANNELGYLIERSTTSAVAGFTVIIGGGVGDGVTTFEDSDVASSTTYWYRIKAINGDCNTYSTAVQMDVPVLYCSTGSSSQCVSTQDEFIANVTIGTINNNSGCVNGGYNNYKSISTDLNAGQTYPISVDIDIVGSTGTFPADMVTVWIDFDQDGSFDTATEEFDLTGPNVYTGNIAVPSTAAGGNTVMRVTVRWNEAPIPCGTSQYGETEDYTINIIPDCDMNTVVTVIGDSGTGTLREAVANTCADGEITFAAGTDDQTTILTSGEISINKDLTIIGNGTNSTTVSGNNASRIFLLANGVELSLEEITFRDGFAATNGGAIYNQGTVNLLNTNFVNNHEGGTDKAMTNVAGAIINVEDTGTVDIKK